MNQLYEQRERIGQKIGIKKGYYPKRAENQKRYMVKALSGVGSKIPKSLLEEFGSVKSLSNAELDDLRKVPGLGKKKAEKVYQILRENKAKYDVSCTTMNAPSIELSRHLFWDIPYKSLNYERDKVFIAKRVVELGTIRDWNILRQRFGIEEITKMLMPIKDLDKKSASSISMISGIPTNLFTCFSTKQSRPKHWMS